MLLKDERVKRGIFDARHENRRFKDPSRKLGLKVVTVVDNEGGDDGESYISDFSDGRDPNPPDP